MALTGSRLPLQTCSTIQALLKDTELSSASIANRTGVSKRTIERMRLSYELFDAPYPPSSGRNGRPRALTIEQEQVSVSITTSSSSF